MSEQQWSAALQRFQQYQTTVEFYNIPHTPRALLTGIQLGAHFSDQDMVDEYALILTTLYQDTPEYVIYQQLSDAN